MPEVREMSEIAMVVLLSGFYRINRLRFLRLPNISTFAGNTLGKNVTCCQFLFYPGFPRFFQLFPRLDIWNIRRQSFQRR